MLARRVSVSVSLHATLSRDAVSFDLSAFDLKVDGANNDRMDVDLDSPGASPLSWGDLSETMAEMGITEHPTMQVRAFRACPTCASRPDRPAVLLHFSFSFLSSPRVV